jgi:hypothetical protein
VCLRIEEARQLSKAALLLTAVCPAFSGREAGVKKAEYPYPVLFSPVALRRNSSPENRKKPEAFRGWSPDLPAGRICPDPKSGSFFGFVSFQEVLRDGLRRRGKAHTGRQGFPWL